MSTIQNGNFSLIVDPFGTWEIDLIDGLTYTVECSLTDQAGNTASTFQTIILDATQPTAIVELFEQSSSIYLSWDLRSDDDIANWSINIRHDGIPVYGLSSMNLDGDVGQRRVSSDLVGIWNLTSEFVDHAGNSQIVEMEIEIKPIEEDTLLGEISQNTLVNMGLAIIIVVLLTIILLRSKRPKMPITHQ